MKLWFLAAGQDAYQLLGGAPGLPVSGRRLQLRTKRIGSRSNSGSGAAPGWIRRVSGQGSLCSLLLLVPWFMLILVAVLLWRVKLHSHLPPLVQDIPGGKQCLGWKSTFFCHPFA